MSKYYEINRKVYNQVDYYMAFGKRSNGKTTQGLRLALEIFCQSKYKYNTAYIRRWDYDFKGGRAKQLFAGVVELGWVKDYTKGEYNSVYYFNNAWYLEHIDTNGKQDKVCANPICYAFNIAGADHYKSNQWPNVKLIIFDEFMTRDYYLPDEFILFQNLLSTIIRDRGDVKILMFGNTVNMYSPYFDEMGLSNVNKQAQGTIDIYTYGDTSLKVAVEYCEDNTKGKGSLSNKYFAFNNPKLRMIQTGEWEINVYPHLPVKYHSSEILYIFYIKFNDVILQCEIIESRELGYPFLFIHKKTTPIKENTESLIFSLEDNPSPYYRKKINRPSDNAGAIIWKFFETNKVFYQNNELGEVVRNYIIYCQKDVI